MTATSKLVLSCLVAVGTVLAVRHGASALHPALPADMPRNAMFVQSGYDLNRNEPTGEWIACHLNSDNSTDLCRVTDAKGNVIFQGEFLPSDDSGPLQPSEIHVASREDQDLWVNGPAEGGPVPVIPLTNGKILVPSADAYALTQRWKSDPSELERVRGE